MFFTIQTKVAPFTNLYALFEMKLFKFRKAKKRTGYCKEGVFMLHKYRTFVVLIIVGAFLFIGLTITFYKTTKVTTPLASPSTTTQRSIANNTLFPPSSVAIKPSPTTTPIIPTVTPTLARKAYMGTPAQKIVPTTFLPGEGPQLSGELAFSGRWIDMYVGSNTLSKEQVVQMGYQAEHALGYMQRRFDEKLNRRVSVGVYHPSLSPDADTRGIAHTRSDLLYIYYTENDDPYDALVILSHELAHQLQGDAYGEDAQSRSDLVLLEGLATWISGEYWLSLSNSTDWQARSYELVHAGYGVPDLNENGQQLASVGSYTGSTVAYELWAGFVDYLTITYGWDSFNELYVSGCGRAPGSANYEGIYGKSFAELVSEWQATLK